MNTYYITLPVDGLKTYRIVADSENEAKEILSSGNVNDSDMVEMELNENLDTNLWIVKERYDSWKD